MIHVYFLGALINWNNAHVLHKSGTIDGNISWYELELTEYPALRFEVHFSFIFGEEICCPIVHIAASLQENYNYFRDVFLGDGNCFSPTHTQKERSCGIKVAPSYYQTTHMRVASAI